MMAITTSSSISVNPGRDRGMSALMGLPPWLNRGQEPTSNLEVFPGS
jgi:hypothetical protein